MSLSINADALKNMDTMIKLTQLEERKLDLIEVLGVKQIKLVVTATFPLSLSHSDSFPVSFSFSEPHVGLALSPGKPFFF